MKVAIVANSKPQSQQVKADLKRMLSSQKIELDDLQPDVVISVGGDGTLISAFHQYETALDHVRFIGLHTGHLGFYTDWRDYNVQELVNQLAKSQIETSTYPLLSLTVTTSVGPFNYLALNEVSIKRVSKTMEADVYIKDELFENFRGDGLCVSTPTGSTAYSKSLGGAIIHPRLKALQMTEIASINNRVFRTIGSPIVVAPDETITILPKDVDDFVIVVDGKQIRVPDALKLEYRIANQTIKFDKFGHTHFWSRVKDAFLGFDEQ